MPPKGKQKSRKDNDLNGASFEDVNSKYFCSLWGWTRCRITTDIKGNNTVWS